ncbi:phosphate transporter subunit; periplasmic-binding component of ABC superfamily [Syntrophobacter sp. SbD1]|nr:phosphate transporter subunit; periplasmic-binding component of ABC superfamily [Syntrophobacter sp. SbD1]
MRGCSVRKYFVSIAVLVCVFVAASAFAADITGAGATFPYPLYAKWAEAYKSKTGVGLNYQSIGSGGGIKQITAKTVDFGASDMPLTLEVLEKGGLMQFPTVMGGVVPVINIQGIEAGKLKLNGEVLAGIYLGTVKKWNDPAIAELNSGLKLPAEEITVVHRSDGSGTTFIFTNYLMKMSSVWKEKVGNDASVSWPAGVGGKGNEGVASYVQQVKNSIGYVEYAYALENKMPYALMLNKEGVYVQPSIESFQSAAAGAKWEQAPGFYEILTNEPGKDSWPITGATFILMHKEQDNADQARAVLKFFSWAYANGGKMAEELDYVPMPAKVVKLIEGSWEKINGPGGVAVWKGSQTVSK